MFNPQTTDEKGGGFIQKNLNLAPYYKQYNNEKLRIQSLTNQKNLELAKIRSETIIQAKQR